jgi:membrane-bound ClpP family serine protease
MAVTQSRIRSVMTTALGIALTLFVLALIVFVIDLLVPSGGILLAITGILCFVSVVFAFRHSPTSGMWMLLATLGLIPLMLFLLIYIWPKTPFGRRMIVKPDLAKEFVWSDAADADPKSLLGAIGLAETEFLPRGSVRINNRSFEAISDVGLIEAGQEVKVTRLDVGRLVVVPTKKPSENQRTMSDGSGLDQPITDLGLDSLE